ncbi:class I SAM-dependent methyltransferase [Candidatus Dependentiae bacterium]|nr:class I SAM-dependent methyltransferase [Candidatus Dependentiae bacterium]
MHSKKLFLISLILKFHLFQASQTYYEKFLIDHVVTSIKNAELYISKLNEDVLNLQGMSSDKVRNFLNNICSFPGAKYLEIGVWQGSTFVSALYNNSLLAATAIDNWSEFTGPKNVFQQNLTTFLPNGLYSFYESDCFKFDLENIKNKINIYFYDGGNTYQDQRMAFTYYNSILEDTCIAIVDDYNWFDVQYGTQVAFEELGYRVLFEQFLSSEKKSFTI